MLKKVAIALVAAVVVCFAVGAREAYLRFEDVKTRAFAAEGHLRKAQLQLRVATESRNIRQIGEAGREFAAARQQFAHISEQVDSLGLLYEIVEFVPGVGEQARAARKLARAAQYVSLAGEEAALGAMAVVDVGRQSPGATNSELLAAVAPIVTERLSAASAAIDTARDEYEAVQGENLHPLLKRALNEFKSVVPRQQALVRSGLELVKALPKLLGSDEEKVYLVLIQDAAELRPTGGFIGNYGVIKFRQGKIVDIAFNDSYQADLPYYRMGKAPPPIGMFARYFPESTFWGLRDANIWPDFERSAQQAAWFAVEEGIAERVDGVIGISDDLVQPLMRVIGPISIPDFGETVDETNVLERIRYHQNTRLPDELQRTLGERPEGNRKLFTARVLGAVTQRLYRLDVDGMIGLGLSIRNGIEGKGVQLYFADSELQRLAEAYDLAGAFKPVAVDYLWVVDMNLGPSKDNQYVIPSIAYSVTLDNSGGAISEVELTYDYTRRLGERYLGVRGRDYHGNYVRVYVPPGSRLLAEEETDEPVETYHEKGKTVFGNFIKMYPSTLRKVKLRYWQPLKLWPGGDTTTYELVVQKQAGNDVEVLEVFVTLPQGATILDPGLFETDGRSLWYRGPLRSDIRLVATLVRNH